MSPSLVSPSLDVLATSLRSLRSKNSSATVVSQDHTRSGSESPLRRRNRLARLKKFCAMATGAVFRRITGRTGHRTGQSGNASAPATDSDSERLASMFPDPECVQHSPSTTIPAVQPPSDVEQHFAVKAEPYFVRSTASASEILTNVAIQDMLATDCLGFYELSCHPGSTSTLSSADSSGFVYPLASSGSSDSDLGVVNESPRRSPVVSPDPSDWHEGSLRGVQIDRIMRLISSTEVEVAFMNTYPDSPPGEVYDDDEEVIMIPVLPRTYSSRPHLLPTIPEEDEDEDGRSSYEDEDETSSVETIRPRMWARPDTGLADGVEHLYSRDPNCKPTHKPALFVFSSGFGLLDELMDSFQFLA